MEIKVEPCECGYIAYSPKYDCYGDGKSKEEAIKDLKAVIGDLIAIYEEVRNED